MTILALVVVYKIDLDSSDTLQSLARQSCTEGLHVFVWDNSPEEASVAKKAWLSHQFQRTNYHHDGKNTPLSTLYNTVIDQGLLGVPEEYQYLILFDQDSIVESTFFASMRAAATQHPEIQLLLPIVKSDDQIVSPARLYYFKGIFWRRPRFGLIKARFTTAINSGMMISAGYLSHYFPGYPPELRFYGTDTWLCQTLSTTHQWVYVVDTAIKHNLAQFCEERTDVKLWRHGEKIRATRFLNRQGFFRRNFCFLYTAMGCIRDAIKYRDRRFVQ